jgi:hypothetical protein
VPVLGFSMDVFLPSSAEGFSQEQMVPTVTATTMAWSIDLESFIV